MSPFFVFYSGFPQYAPLLLSLLCYCSFFFFNFKFLFFDWLCLGSTLTPVLSFHPFNFLKFLSNYLSFFLSSFVSFLFVFFSFGHTTNAHRSNHMVPRIKPRFLNAKHMHWPCELSPQPIFLVLVPFPDSSVSKGQAGHVH